MSETHPFQVSVTGFGQLSKNERLSASNNGCGKEYANYIRVSRHGVTVYLESDAIEPEDARFTRDLSWVMEALRYAYECGKSDGKLD